MSQIFVLRKPLYIAETTLFVGDTVSIYFKSLYISTSITSGTSNFTLAITNGKSYSAVGDYLVFTHELTAGGYVKLEDIAVPVGHFLIGCADQDLKISVVGTGVME